MFLLDRSYIRHFDWVGFLLVILLSSIGLLFVFSATYRPEQPFSIYFKKQLFAIISGWIIYALCCSADYRSLIRWGYFAYIGVIGLLIFTIIKGSIGMGAQRWINLYFFKVQPSELAKLLFPAFISYYMLGEKEKNFSSFVPLLAILGISFLLIAKQPDLGTALILAFTGLITLWLSGISRKFFIIGFIATVIGAPILWTFLKPYQKQRIAVFLGEGDVRKERYQLEQAKIAIGSGGMWGKGYLQGTQNKFLFLPESRTDFIFAVIGELVWYLVCYLLLVFHYR
jgi:rod shape determining protein RodA